MVYIHFVLLTCLLFKCLYVFYSLLFLLFITFCVEIIMLFVKFKYVLRYSSL